jgi:uncharacterized damage-inducible protein DinB
MALHNDCILALAMSPPKPILRGMSNPIFSQRPDPSEHFIYYGNYTNRVPDGDVFERLTTQNDQTQNLLRGLSDAQALFRPGPHEWSIKQVVGHMIDTERIMAFRALSFARNEQAHIPGMNQNDYVKAARFDELSLSHLLDEFAAVRAATLLFLAGLNEAELNRRGVASDNPITVRALIWIIAGHELHHLDSLNQDYLLV